VQYYSTIKRMRTDHAKPPQDLPDTEEAGTNLWIYGPTGSGKSFIARQIFEDKFYDKNASNKWWDGYQQEDNVLLDDFDKKHEYMGFYLKRWADRYSFNAEVKGGTINARPKRIIVTSNCHPAAIWGEQVATLNPIMRRFKVIRIDQRGDWIEE